MDSSSNRRPIIIKRRKTVIAPPHHSGAWKVAYADFVTAMMAFFMLMWLLNATTEQQRKGIADYFSPTIPITRISGGGDGSFGGDSVFSETTIAQSGTGATSRRPTEGRQAMGLQGSDHSVAREEATLEALEDMLLGQGGDSRVSDLALTHVQTRLSDEGLIIEVFSRPDSPLFDPVSGAPAPWLPALSRVMADLFQTVTNPVAIAGHVAAEAVVVATESRWEVSVARAQALRLLLEDGGLDPDRVARVTGHANRAPVTEDAMAPRNDRIEIVLLRTRL